MSTLRELKSRIGSVASTQKTTSAMKMISSAKMHKFTGQLQRLSPYRDMVQTTLSHLLLTDVEFDSPLIETREVKNVAIVVFGSDDGLCGAFNINIVKRLQEILSHVDKHYGKGVNVTVFPVGRKVVKSVKRNITTGVNIETTDYMSTRSTSDDLSRFTASLRERFLDGEFDKVDVLYMHFKSTSRQVLQLEQLLPVSYEALAHEADAKQANSPCIFEPDANSIFNSVLPLFVRSMMQDVFTQSSASEQASRVMAMQTASDNAKELLETLNLEYNKLRQQSITTELLDILGGQVQR
ncbi:MAG: ATP synthase F1 subunit gamma [Muribaculaceae bacterium]|jgi:F-type H+-transporting ATPase subunit gamma|nr:ATP synthase F1 subunit gamma [Muribaculaceae bacterium]MBQ2490693.1 ATP synthase F1 subunit gamma [Muribaculaceae bacterium]MBQ3961748.1 ATP synthase F1 subunit gamma [Muribaculaceae bacterium]MBQ4007667.1 ATP synthase F1 subunit gamma [Muribaculaceae bacterium]